MSPDTAARRRAVRALVSRETVTSQRQLADMLAAAGYAVTQATVSRDLDAIGAVKSAEADNRHRYLIPGAAPASEEMALLERLLAEFVEEIVVSGNLVVLKTPPGAAQVVAGAIDRAQLDLVAGTVAGDDTILAVAAEDVGGRRLAQRFERIGVGR